MAFEQRDNSGTLSRNDRKEKPNHPDHRGSCIINGEEYWISAWIKEGRNGKFFSLAFQPKDGQRHNQSSNLKDDCDCDCDDDIPF